MTEMEAFANQAATFRLTKSNKRHRGPGHFSHKKWQSSAKTKKKEWLVCKIP